MCYSGRNGSGKTFNLTIKARRRYKRSCLHWLLVNKSIFRKTKKAKKSELYNQEKPKLYSNYPIIIDKQKYKKTKRYSDEWIKYDKYVYKLSKMVEIGYIDNTKPFPLGSIVVIDEFSRFLNQFVSIKDKEYQKTLENIGDNLTFWRHYHGNYSNFLVSSQCTNEINHNIRYKLNQSICFDSTKHYLKLIHISKYRVIDLTDNIKTMDETSTDNKDLNDKYCTIVHFGKCRYYDDRCFSERYRVVDKKPKSKSPLKIEEIVKPTLNANYNDILLTYDYNKIKTASASTPINEKK